MKRNLFRLAMLAALIGIVITLRCIEPRPTKEIVLPDIVITR